MMQCSVFELSDVPGRRNGERGFTLVEMMVVVAMIALIVGISLPNLWRASVRAEMMGQVSMVQQAVAVSRIYAIKNGSQVALQLIPDGDAKVTKYRIHSWVDGNANGVLDAGEEEVGGWSMMGDMTIGPVYDPPDKTTKDSDLTLTPLAGSARGVIFLANGTAIVHDSQIGTGRGGVCLHDTYDNVLRIRIQGGSGSVLVDMYNWELEDWIDNPKNLWRY
jgi:prepilin-type N-terminal cleavage/methylation domain-containing protein